MGDTFISIIEISVAKSKVPEKMCKNTKIPSKRTYFHPQTYLPLSSNEIQKHTTSDLLPKWAFHKIVKNIDEYTDVNDGEKEIMKMWSGFVSNINIVGDYQVPRAIDLFIEKYGRIIRENNWYKNFVLHLINLHDFHVITPKVVFEATCKFKRENPVIATENWEELEYHTDSGVDTEMDTSENDNNEDGVILPKFLVHKQWYPKGPNKSKSDFHI